MSTQASVSSAWRFTHRVSEPTRTMSVPSAKSTQTRIVRVRGLTRGSRPIVEALEADVPGQKAQDGQKDTEDDEDACSNHFALALYRIHRQLFTSHRWGEVRRLPPCEDLVAQQFEKQKRRSNGNSGNPWLDGRSCRFAGVMMMLIGTFHTLPPCDSRMGV